MLVLAACGGGSPAIAPTEGKRLAQLSDAVAARLAAGDGCGAAQAVTALRTTATTAIRQGLVPRELATELGRRTALLSRAVVCVPPPARPAAPTPAATTAAVATRPLATVSAPAQARHSGGKHGQKNKKSKHSKRWRSSGHGDGHGHGGGGGD